MRKLRDAPPFGKHELEMRGGTATWPQARETLLATYDRKAARFPEQAEQIRSFQALLRKHY